MLRQCWNRRAGRLDLPLPLANPSAARTDKFLDLPRAAALCKHMRTSLATNAKPRPSALARAASTAAFNDRKLVWNAIESMMSSMRFDDWLIARIVFTT